MVLRDPFGSFVMAATVLAVGAVGFAGAPGTPHVLPTAGATFPAPYDAVWDATLKSLGAPILRVADKATGRIETKPFPFAYTAGQAPAHSPEPARLAALEATGAVLSQGGGDGPRPTQVIWIAMTITVTRAAEPRTDMQVEPRIYDSPLTGFIPGPANSPWVDLFARIAERLGRR